MGESKTNISLNIYTEPWIDANLINGHKERLSIRDCFVRAKEIYSLFIEDAQYALDNTVPYTMLTLILARTFMPGQDEKLEMLKEDGFDIESIDDYILSCEQKGISFDVFDEINPFLQDAKYQTRQDKKPKTQTVGRLEPFMVSGNNTVFYHSRDFNTNGKPVQDTLRMTPPQYIASVARNYMYHNSSGNSCGTGYSPANPPLHCIIHGRNLYETLILSIPKNLCGVPLWERKYDMTVPEIIKEYGHLDYISAAFLPTVSIRFGEIEDAKVKSIWYRGSIYKDKDKEKEKPKEFIAEYRVKSETGMNMLFLKSSKKSSDSDEDVYFPAMLTTKADLTSTILQIMQAVDRTGDKDFIEKAREEYLLNDKFQFVVYGGILSTTDTEPFSTTFNIPIPAALLDDKVNGYVKEIAKCIEYALTRLQMNLLSMEREICRGSVQKESGTIRTITRHFAEYACDQLVPNAFLHDTWIEKITKEPTDEILGEICADICFKAEEAFYSYRANDIRIVTKYAAYLSRALKEVSQGADADVKR